MFKLILKILTLVLKLPKYICWLTITRPVTVAALHRCSYSTCLPVADPAMGSPDSRLTLLILPEGGWDEVRGRGHTHSSHSSRLWGVKCSPSWLFPPLHFLWFFFPGNYAIPLSSPLLVTNQSSLTKSTFNPSLGPLVLPDGGGWVLAAVCDPALINRVGEGKGAMHTPIHYLIRMAHSERWSPSLYLNDRGWTQHSVRHPVRLLPSTCLFTLLHETSHHFTQRLTAARKSNLMNSYTQWLVAPAHLELNNAPIIYSQVLCRIQHQACIGLQAIVCAQNQVRFGAQGVKGEPGCLN